MLSNIYWTHHRLTDDRDLKQNFFIYQGADVKKNLSGIKHKI